MAENSNTHPASFTRQALIVLGLLAVALFVWKIAPVLMLLFAGVVMATAVYAGSVPLRRHLRMNSTLAVATVFILLLVVLAGVGVFFGHELATQASELWGALTGAWQSLAQRLKSTPVGATILENAQGANPTEAVGRVAKGAITVFGGVTDIVLILFLAIYFAIDPALYRNGFLLLLPPGARARVGGALDASAIALRKWLLGQLCAMLTVGILIGIGLALVGVPLAFALGILSGILEFVPVVGPFAGALPGVLIAFAQGPENALYAIGVYTVVLFLEGNVVMPLAQKWAVSLPPALGLLAIVAFGLVFGLLGVLFAIPLTVVVVVLVQELYVKQWEAADKPATRRAPRRA
jgi:predicted PurR-regulated permease PerM